MESTSVKERVQGEFFSKKRVSGEDFWRKRESMGAWWVPARQDFSSGIGF
jgi:hypothetical protein